MVGGGKCRFLAGLVLVSSIAALAGCGHEWRVIRADGPPSPLKGIGPISVSFDYSKLYIGGKTEAEYVQSKLVKEPDYATKWAELKAAFESNFMSSMQQEWPGVQMGAPGSQPAHVFVVPTGFTAGHYMVVAATATSVTAMMNFVVAGKEADQIEIIGAQSATIYTPSVHQHMPGVGRYIGRGTGRYVKSKQ